MANIEMNVLKVGNSEFEIADAAARQDVSNLKDDFHSYHSELGAGYADQIVSGIENTDSVPYNFRKVPYDATLEKVDGIVGVDVVLNQLVENGNFADGAFGWGGVGNWKSYEVVDGTLHLVSNANQVDYANVYRPIANGVKVNHVYVVSYYVKASKDSITGGSLGTLSGGGGISGQTSYTANAWLHRCGLSKPTSYTDDQLYIRPKMTTDAEEVDVYLKNIFCTDLTQVFGTTIAEYIYSLESATTGAGVAWLKANAPKIFDGGYIPYNAGTMVHVSGLSAKKTVGKNQINVNESESGGINASGVEVTDPNNWRGTEYIPVIGGMEYVLSSQIETKRLYFYDESYNFISPRAEGSTPVVTATAPVNAKYVRWTLYKGRTMSYEDVENSKTQLEFGSTATTYEPYTEHTYPLDSSIDLHGILKLDSNNNLYADGDVYEADGTVTRRYGVVDLGTLNWGISSNNRFTATSTGIYFSANNNELPKAILSSAMYVPATGNTYINYDASYYVSINGSLFIRNVSYSDAATFKQAMSGVILVYELATPTTETAEPYQQTQIIDPDGTEEFVSTSVVPVGHITKYPENLRKKIEGLPWNFASLIAPTEVAFVATRNYTTGSLFIVNNVLYKATANIANGATITPNSNCTSTTLAEVISALS